SMIANRATTRGVRSASEIGGRSSFMLFRIAKRSVSSCASSESFGELTLSLLKWLWHKKLRVKLVPCVPRTSDQHATDHQQPAHHCLLLPFALHQLRVLPDP